MNRHKKPSNIKNSGGGDMKIVRLVYSTRKQGLVNE
jgi:hypothetical protein